MSPKKPTNALRSSPWMDLRIPFAVCAALGLLLLGLLALLVWLGVPYLPYIGLALLVLYALPVGCIFTVYAIRYGREKRAEDLAEQQSSDIYRMFRATVHIPYAVVSGDGRVRVVNAAMQSILGLRSPVCNLPLGDICKGVTVADLSAILQKELPAGISDPASVVTDREAASFVSLSDGKRYEMTAYPLDRDGDVYYFLVFHDVTEYLKQLEAADRNHTVMAYIVLDNLQELTQFVRANYRATANIIEETLSRWVSGMNGMIREYDRDKYLALFSSEMLDRCIRDDFSILEEIMSIRVGDNSFPLSVSMGIADVDGSMQEREKAAKAAKKAKKKSKKQ